MADRARAQEVVEVARASHALPTAQPDPVTEMIQRAVKAIT